MGWLDRCGPRRGYGHHGSGWGRSHFRGPCNPFRPSRSWNLWPFFRPSRPSLVFTTPSPAIGVPVTTYPTRSSPEAAAIVSGIFLTVMGAALTPVSMGAGLGLAALGITLIAGGIASASLR